MQRQYKSGAAKRKLRVEQEKRDQHIKKKMPCLLTYGFETSLISNSKHKKPSLGEDKNEYSKTNEAKITSKSSYQISVAVIESDANVDVSQPPTTLHHLSLMDIKSELLRKQNFEKMIHEFACGKAHKVPL